MTGGMSTQFIPIIHDSVSEPISTYVCPESKFYRSSLKGCHIFHRQVSSPLPSLFTNHKDLPSACSLVAALIKTVSSQLQRLDINVPVANLFLPPPPWIILSCYSCNKCIVSPRTARTRWNVLPFHNHLTTIPHTLEENTFKLRTSLTAELTKYTVVNG